jgi:hypothetical protein
VVFNAEYNKVRHICFFFFFFFLYELDSDHWVTK